MITVDDWQYSSRVGRKPGRAARSSRSNRLEILRSGRSDWRCFLSVLKSRGRLGSDIHHCHNNAWRDSNVGWETKQSRRTSDWSDGHTCRVSCRSKHWLVWSYVGVGLSYSKLAAYGAIGWICMHAQQTQKDDHRTPDVGLAHDSCIRSEE